MVVMHGASSAIRSERGVGRCAGVVTTSFRRSAIRSRWRRRARATWLRLPLHRTACTKVRRVPHGQPHSAPPAHISPLRGALARFRPPSTAALDSSRCVACGAVRKTQTSADMDRSTADCKACWCASDNMVQRRSLSEAMIDAAAIESSHARCMIASWSSLPKACHRMSSTLHINRAASCACRTAEETMRNRSASLYNANSLIGIVYTSNSEQAFIERSRQGWAERPWF